MPFLYSKPQSFIIRIIQTTTQHPSNIKNKKTPPNVIETKSSRNNTISHNLQENFLHPIFPFPNTFIIVTYNFTTNVGNIRLFVWSLVQVS